MKGPGTIRAGLERPLIGHRLMSALDPEQPLGAGAILVIAERLEPSLEDFERIGRDVEAPLPGLVARVDPPPSLSSEQVSS